MSIEDKLKDLILKRYHSIREFTIEIDLPYSTMTSIFNRGINNANLSNVIKICKTLGISADALADGEIIPVKKRPTSPINERIEVKEILSDTKDLLTHSGEMTLDGKPIGKSDIESIIDAMDVGVEIVRRKS